MTTLDNIAQVQEVKKRQVWDLPVRVFHWTLVAAIIGAFVTNRLGVSYFKYHVWCGYTVIVLVLFRIVWGVVGTRHAQFWNFVCGPAATLRYVLGLLRGHEIRYAGHNPLGAWMVVTLLAALGIQAFSGLFGNDDIFNVGPLYGYVSKEVSLRLTSLHRHLFYWIMAAAAVHILAVIAHHVFERANLLHAMITGHKSHDSVAESDGIVSSRTWLAVLVSIAIAAALAWVVNHAPVPIDDALY
jgi:cytochrome b